MKKMLVSLLCAVMVVTFMPSMAFATVSQTPQGIENEQTQAKNDRSAAQNGPEAAGPNVQTAAFEGAGTTAEPYLIKSADDLKTLAEKVNKGEADYASAVYKQTAEINLEGSAEKQWTPIGTSAHKFTGTFIGTDFEIKGLHINDANLENAGLFGYIANPAKLEGITLDGAVVTGKSDVGTIAGAAFTGTAKNCIVKGKITVKGNYKVGGMFGGGYVQLSNCKVEADAGSTVTGIYKENNLEGDNVGGLIGFRGEGTSPTTGCTVTGVTVAGTRKVGGLIGSVFTDNIVEGCKVSNTEVVCNATKDYGEANAKSLGIGGMLGLYTKNGNNDGTLKNCVAENITLKVENPELAAADKVTMGYVSGGQRGETAPVAPKTTINVEQVKVTGTNTGSNAEVKIPDSVIVNGEPQITEQGSGTEKDPYIISSVDELKNFADAVNNKGVTYKNQYIEVKAGKVLDLSGEKWTPIGTPSNRFMGTFDGNGATVKGLTTSFFGGIEDATIKNLKLAEVNIANAIEQGALLLGNTKDVAPATERCVGTITIDGIEVTGSIKGGGDYVGGIIGGRATMDDGDVITIKNCINRATITGTTDGGKTGGIIGYTNSRNGKWVVENCKNYGDITSKDWAGGITSGTTKVAISSCINEGNINGVEVTGGIVGTANSGTTVTGSSNKGDIVDAQGSAGGIIGSSSSGTNTVSQSANTGEITGVTSAAGIIGGTLAAGDAIDNCYNGGAIKATGDDAIAAGIYGYNNSTSPVKACVNDAKVEASKGTAYHIGLSNYWYGEATGSKIATCYYIEDGKIFAVAEDGNQEPVEQNNMTRTELAETLNTAGNAENFWQPQNGSVQPDPIIPGVLEDENRIVLIKDKDGKEVEGYTSLAEAAEAVKDGQTIVLEKNVTLESTLVIKGNKNVTLDLKGKTLTLADNVDKVLLEVGNKETGEDATHLTLTDSAAEKGTIKSKANKAAICVRTGASMTTKDVKISFKDTNHDAANATIQVQGKLTVENGTEIDSTEYGITVVEPGAQLVVNDGKINSADSAVSGNGLWSGTEIIINGGTLTSRESAGIYHPQDGKLTLNGGIITGLTGVQMCAGELIVPENSTAKVTATGEDNRNGKDGGDGPIVDGAAISLVNRSYPGDAPKADIRGGSFKAEKAESAVIAYTWNAQAQGDKHSKWDKAGEQIDIAGGSYNTAVEESFLKEGFEIVKDADGNYIVKTEYIPPYIPPTDPVQKPVIEAEEGATVTLGKDGTTATIVVDKDATLKDVLLNGKSLGAVTEVKDLKTGDKLVVIVETAAEKNTRLKAGVENTTIKLKSTLGKGHIKLNWTKSQGYKVDYYEVFRSVKKNSGYGKKAYFKTTKGGLKGWYKNTKQLKKGTRYYYKVRGVREIAGEKVYTKYSNKAWRLVK